MKRAASCQRVRIAIKISRCCCSLTPCLSVPTSAGTGKLKGRRLSTGHGDCRKWTLVAGSKTAFWTFFPGSGSWNRKLSSNSAPYTMPDKLTSCPQKRNSINVPCILNPHHYFILHFIKMVQDDRFWWLCLSTQAVSVDTCILSVFDKLLPFPSLSVASWLREATLPSVLAWFICLSAICPLTLVTQLKCQLQSVQPGAG